ncbi:MAG: nucleotidyltransferase domain-containing protein [Gaiellaceae bacterium]
MAALREVARTLRCAEIEYWLFGGWAVDFYAGSTTRAHDDLDLAIWLHDMPKIEPLLAATGWTDLHDPDADGGKAFRRGSVRLELTYLYVGEDGEVYTPLRDGRRGRWPGAALGDDAGELAGVRSRLVSLAALRTMKANRRDDAVDAAKDRVDAAVIERLS